jgi:hypothetical protein
MYRTFLLALAALLVAVAPVWNYSHDWTFGPFIAILLLLGLNLSVYIFAQPQSDDGSMSGPDRQALSRK